ncbi:MAG: hypothetical protein V4568_06005 [Pseudomonadota bacterium]
MEIDEKLEHLTPRQEWEAALDALILVVNETKEKERKIDIHMKQVLTDGERFDAERGAFANLMRNNNSADAQIEAIKQRIEMGEKIVRQTEMVAENCRFAAADIREKLDVVNGLYFTPGKIVGDSRKNRMLPLIHAYKALKGIKEKLDENESVIKKCNQQLLYLPTQMASLKLFVAQTNGSVGDSLEVAQTEFVEAWKRAGEVFFVSEKGEFGGRNEHVIEGRKNSIEVAINIRHEKLKSLLSGANSLGDKYEERSSLLESAIEEVDAIVEHYGHLVAADEASVEFKQLKRYFQCLAINIGVHAFQINETHIAQKAGDTEIGESLTLLAEHSAAIDQTAASFGLWENLGTPESYNEQSLQSQARGYEKLAENCKDLPLLYETLKTQSTDPALDEILQKTIEIAKWLKERIDETVTSLSMDVIASPQLVEGALQEDQSSEHSVETSSELSIALSANNNESVEVSKSERAAAEIAQLIDKIKEDADQLEQQKRKIVHLQNKPAEKKLPLIEEACFKKIAIHAEALEKLCGDVAAQYFSLAGAEEGDLAKHAEYLKKTTGYLSEKKRHFDSAQNAKDIVLKFRNTRFREAPNEDLLLEIKDSELKELITIKLPHAPEVIDENGEYIWNDKKTRLFYDHVVEHQLVIKGDIVGDIRLVVHEHFHVEGKQEGVTAEMLMSGKCGKRVATVIKKWDEKGKGHRYIQRLKKIYGVRDNHPNGRFSIYHSQMSEAGLKKLYEWKKTALKKAVTR